MSSANDIVQIWNLFLGERHLCMHSMNKRGPRIEPWGTPCLNVPQSEKENLRCIR